MWYQAAVEAWETRVNSPNTQHNLKMREALDLKLKVKASRCEQHQTSLVCQGWRWDMPACKAEESTCTRGLALQIRSAIQLPLDVTHVWFWTTANGFGRHQPQCMVIFCQGPYEKCPRGWGTFYGGKCPFHHVRSKRYPWCWNWKPELSGSYYRSNLWLGQLIGDCRHLWVPTGAYWLVKATY
jgi:hypothetical protein